MIIGYDGSKLGYAHKTGTEHYATILLQNLLEIDHKNHYRIYLRQANTSRYLQQSNVETRVINYPRLWTQLGLAKEVATHHPDVLFIPAHTMPILHRPSLKCVVTIHDLGYEYLPQYHQFPHKLYLNRTTEFAAQHATRLIAVSEFTKRDLIRKLNVPEERIAVVYEGVDLETNQRSSMARINEVSQKYDLSRPYIAFVSTIQPRKNLVRLIEAFSQIADLFPQLDLVLAGGRGWLSDEIYAAPVRLRIEDRVKFLGYIDELDKPALYSGAELTAFVSLFEGFGLPVLESMACGTPTVVANSSSLPEVAGDASILVDPEDTVDIANGLKTVLSEPKLRQQLVSRGLDQVKKFSWQNTAKGTLQVLHEASQV